MDYLGKLSFQLYSSRQFPPLGRQLETLAAIGYRQVEPYGGLFADAPALVAGLRAAGLTAPSSHVGLDMVRAERTQVAEVAGQIGLRHVIVPYLAQDERPADSAGWAALAGELESLAAAYAEDGLTLGWHNHDFEFATLADGGVPMALLLDNAPSLAWEPDLAWTVRGGADPLVWLDRYQGRVVACHIKDIAPAGENADEDGWADVGHGVLDWAALAPACVAAGAALLVVEHDAPKDFERAARRSRDTVAKW
ncbi:MAG: sugar phosphate isomerase/epimerase [Alphaproteobacteria bacterium]